MEKREQKLDELERKRDKAAEKSEAAIAAWRAE
jgi:hypothetical protein